MLTQAGAVHALSAPAIIVELLYSSGCHAHFAVWADFEERVRVDDCDGDRTVLQHALEERTGRTLARAAYAADDA